MTKMNKRGDMPTVLIFVMALVLSVAALFSFATFKNDAQKQSIDLANVQRGIDFNQNYILKSSELIGGRAIKEGSSDLRQAFINIAKQRDIQLYGSGNFFGKVESGDFMFNKLGSGYVFDIRNLVIFSEVGQNKIRRSFNLSMAFDSNGALIEKNVIFNS